METTNKLGLRKPSISDPVEIDDINTNMDKIDEAFDEIPNIKVNSARNADRVNNKTVEANVPEDAKFTDTNTIYTAGDNILITEDNVISAAGEELTKYTVEAALTHTIDSDVPADAIFTDTVIEYFAGENIDITETNVISTKATELTKSNVENALTYTINAHVPNDAVFTDTNTTYTAGEHIAINPDRENQIDLDLDKEGIEAIIGHSVDSDVPEGAIFTDTEYTAGDNITITEENIIHAEGEKLTKDVLEGYLGHTIESDVPEGAVFTDTTYEPGQFIKIEGNVISYDDGATFDGILAEIIGDTSFSFAYGGAAVIKYNVRSILTQEVTASFYVDGLLRATQRVNNGDNEFDIGPHLRQGTNDVRVNFSNVYGKENSLSYSIRGEVLRVTSYFNEDREYTGDIRFMFTPMGSLQQTAYIKIDGTIAYEIPVERAGTQITQIIPALSHGGHVIEVYSQSSIGGATISSNVLEYTIVATEEGNKTPIIATNYKPEDKIQGELVRIPYKVYTPDFNHSNVQLYINGELTGQVEADRNLQNWDISSYPIGTVSFTITTGEVTETFIINVEPSAIDVEAVMAGLQLHLTSEGKSNAGVDRESWTYKGIEAQLTGFNYRNNGWIVNDNDETVLRLSGSSRVFIPYNLFDSDVRAYGKTVEFEFMMSNVADRFEPVISCMSGNIGVSITGQDASISSQQINNNLNEAIKVNFKEDEKIRVSFVMESTQQDRLIYVYLNGIMSAINRYGENDHFTQSNPVGISIGSNYVDTDLYAIREYDTALTAKQVLDNYIADTRNLVEKTSLFNKNQIFDDFSNVDYNLVLEQLPSLTVIGPIPQQKGHEVSSSLLFAHKEDPTRDFYFQHDPLISNKPLLDVQGTSSQYYPRKNFKMTFPEEYQLRRNSIPESVYTFKADYMDSSHALNTGLARLTNDLMYKVAPVPPQVENPAIRTTIDGYVCAIFHEKDGVRECLGAYNFNNDKADFDTFGQVPGAECWELRNNNSDRCNFVNWDTATEDFFDDFESRFPKDIETMEEAANFDRLGRWISSTRVPEGEFPTKFVNEVEQYMELDLFIAYYVIAEFFGLVDSLAKNLFFSTWDGNYWYPIFYDLDTALGLTNTGELKFPFDIEVHDNYEDGKVYNGHRSTLWENIKNGFPTRVRDMYHKLRAMGLDYENATKELIEKQIDVIPEAMYNHDADYKYIRPYFETGENYFYVAQGSRKNHLQWWLDNRISYLDSKYDYKNYSEDYISLRLYSPEGELAITPDANFNIVPSEDMYVSMRFGSADQKVRAKANQIVNMKAEGIFNDTETIIYGAGKISSVGDLSAKYIGTVDFSKATRLRELIIGSDKPGYRNTNLLNLPLGNNRLLRKLDVRNCPNLRESLDVSGCYNIEEIYATGTSIPSISLPVGGIVKSVYLPDTIVSLNIQGQNSIQDFVLEDYNNIASLRIENSSGIPLESLILNSPNLERVRFLGTELHFTNADPLIKVMNLAGLDQNGNNVAKAVITGECHLETVTYKQLMMFKEVLPELKVTYTTLDYDFTIKFVNWDGTLLDTQPLKLGEYAIDPTDPELRKVDLLPTPTRPSDGEDADLYEYVFVEWQPNFSTLQEDAIIKATYTHDEVVIRFVNWNGEELQVLDRQAVKPGVEIPTDPITREIDPIDTPTRLDSETESYTFSGWDTELTTFVKHTTISAEYDITSLHTVTFINWDGDILEVQKVLDGGDATPPDTPSRPDEGNTRFEFASWNNDYTSVYEDRVVKAEYAFTKFYIVTFMNKDGGTIYIEEVLEGENASDPLELFYSPQPTETDDNYFAFWKWDKEFTNITQDLVVTELYNVTPKFLVRFLNHDGSVIHETKVVRGNRAQEPVETPVREKDGTYNYLFTGWNKTFNNIQGELDVTAQYDAIEYFTVRFHNYLEEEINVQEINKGSAAVDPVTTGFNTHKPSDEDSDIYTFMGWDKPFANVYDNLNIYPEYFAGVPSQFPGPVNIIGGDMMAGFYGEVPAGEFFTGAELTSNLKVVEGTAQNSNTSWLKFAIDGRILYKSKKPIRHSISWDYLKDKGLVDGSTTIVKNGITYRVRLMRDGYLDSLSDNPKETIFNSEWNRLMLPIHEAAETNLWENDEYVGSTTDNWGIGYTDLDLNLTGTTNGVTHWTQNSYIMEVPGEFDEEGLQGDPTYETRYRSTARGYYGTPYWETIDSAANNNSMGWSPVLEVVLPGPKDLIAFYEGAGFYGETTVSELYSGLQLAAEIGLTHGTAQFSDEPWLKFVIDGRIIYKSKKSYRHSINWDAIDAVNAVFGDRTLTKDGIRYKIRLMSTSLHEDMYETSGVITHGSEYNRLIYPIHENASTGLWNYPDNVEDYVPDWGVHYKDVDINATTSHGRSQWMQQQGSSPDHRVARGVHGPSRSLQYYSNERQTIMGWSPVLEVY